MARSLNLKMILLTLVPCSSPSLIALKGNKSHSHYKILANYNGQAELLLSLQIPPDYFPYQFKQRDLYDYLTNIKKYFVTTNASEKKQQLADKIQTRINQLIKQVTTFGPSLWNEDLYAGGLVNRNVQFWNTKSADYLFLEQFIIDDSSDPLFLIQRLPRHSHLAITNFRAARDPYTLFSQDVYDYFGKPDTRPQKSNIFAEKLYEYYKSFSKISPNTLFRSGKYMEFWHEFYSALTEKLQSSKTGGIKELFSIPEKDELLFTPYGKKAVDRKIAKEFFEAIFTEDEKKFLDEAYRDTKLGDEFTTNYLKDDDTLSPGKIEKVSISSSQLKFQQVHHPALEHQTMKGSSPVSEGTQKDLFVYLAQMAIALSKVTETSNFETVFGKDQRKEFIKKAWDNAVEIAQNYRKRLEKIREYLKSINVVDKEFDPKSGNHKKQNSKTLAIISYPPSQLGAGDATIQTISKYPFLYTDLGLNEVIPKSFENTSNEHDHSEILGVDDNGWWWKLGDFNFDSKGLDDFGDSADSIILLATEDDWNIINSWDNPKLNSLRSLLTEEQKQKKGNVNVSSYHLWNEGLRSPIALNLLLDELVKLLTKQFGGEKTDDTERLYQEALDWGSYWENKFVAGL